MVEQRRGTVAEQRDRFADEEHELLAALVLRRFRYDEVAAIAAWKRMLENGGWDDTEGRREWRRMADRGAQRLRHEGLLGAS
jgi:hypothetical protein